MTGEKKKLLFYLKRYWFRFTISLISAALYGVVSALPSYIIKHTVDDIFIKNYRHLIVPLLGVFVLFFILKGIFMYSTTYYMQWVGNRIVTDIRYDFFSKIIYFPLSFYQKHSTGSLMSYFLTDAQLIQNGFERVVKNGVRSFFEAFFLIAWAFVLSWKLALLMVIIGPVIGITILIVGKAIKRASRRIQQEMALVSTVLQEIFIGIREIKSFNGEENEIKRFGNYLSQSFIAFKKNVAVEAFLPACIEPIAMVGGALAFYVATQQVLAGTMTPGSMASFFAAVLLSYQPLKRLMCMYSTMQGVFSAAERLFNVMDTAEYPAPCVTSHKSINFRCALELHDISFSYEDGTPVFTNASLMIKKGDIIGIVGPSGSGKSTLCDMLLGFIVPISGHITIDGSLYSDLSLIEIRNSIGYVGQRTFLFNDTVKNNVMYPQHGISQDTVIAASKAAHAHEFIVKLKDGYESFVGENGNLLSGGQKQRLTIARALLKAPEILIFDEATSALDHGSEKIIQQTIESLRGKKTIIIITHRPSLLECADRIVHISQGTIIETLLKSKSDYLHQIQE